MIKMELEIADVITPNCFYVRPVRREPLPPEVAAVMRIEAGLAEWADHREGKIDEGNVENLREKEIVSARVKCLSFIIPSH